mmetsp:Transcript_1463/g.4313  ORF Transcript_1463/g.4313 Transcript_1463/m.4313 type:complete len:276 (-) Transcript_1463:340-1167(-)
MALSSPFSRMLEISLVIFIFLTRSLSRKRSCSGPMLFLPTLSTRGKRFFRANSGVATLSGMLSQLKKPRSTSPDTNSSSWREKELSSSMALNTSYGPPSVSLHHFSNRSRMPEPSGSRAERDMAPLPSSAPPSFCRSIQSCRMSHLKFSSPSAVQYSSKVSSPSPSLSKKRRQATVRLPFPCSFITAMKRSTSAIFRFWAAASALLRMRPCMTCSSSCSSNSAILAFMASGVRLNAGAFTPAELAAAAAGGSLAASAAGAWLECFSVRSASLEEA